MRNHNKTRTTKQAAKSHKDKQTSSGWSLDKRITCLFLERRSSSGDINNNNDKDKQADDDYGSDSANLALVHGADSS